MHNLPNWQLDPENKETKKLNEILNSQATKLAQILSTTSDKVIKESAVYSFYRKYYTLTLNKACLGAGINRSPSRDIILDYPWKDLNLNRIFCLKIWEKINH